MVKRVIAKIFHLVFDRTYPFVAYLCFPFYYLVELLSFVTKTLLYLRNEHLKVKLKSCGTGVRFHGKFSITGAKHIEIGNNVHINDNAFIRGNGGLVVEDNVHIGKNLVIYTINHNFQGEALPYDDTSISKPVTIGKNVWIGINVTITPGVTIGEGAIIAMGSVVSKDVAPLAIVASNKVIVIRERDKEHYNNLEDLQRYGGMGGL